MSSKTEEDIIALYAERERIWQRIAQLFRNQGMPISHTIFKISVEDLITVLVSMVQDGSFDPDDAFFFPPTLVDGVQDECEQSIEWGAVLRFAINEYLSGIREEKEEYERKHLPSKGGAGT